MNRLFYNMLETASAYHNAEMGGQRWTAEQQQEKARDILLQICDGLGVDLDKLYDLLCVAVDKLDDMPQDRWTDDLQKVYDNINGVAGQIFYMKENQ